MSRHIFIYWADRLISSNPICEKIHLRIHDFLIEICLVARKHMRLVLQLI